MDATEFSSACCFAFGRDFGRSSLHLHRIRYNLGGLFSLFFFVYFLCRPPLALSTDTRRSSSELPRSRARPRRRRTSLTRPQRARSPPCCTPCAHSPFCTSFAGLHCRPHSPRAKKQKRLRQISAASANKRTAKATSRSADLPNYPRMAPLFNRPPGS